MGPWERGSWIAVPKLFLLVAATGCAGTQARGLLVTEVGRRAIELTFDEPTGTTLTLGGGYTLSLRTGTDPVRSVGLGNFGQSIPAGGFFMVWAPTGYSGPVVAESFPSGQQGPVPGIKVPSSFFDGINNSPGEVRLSGTRNRASGLIVIIPVFTEDSIDDVVRFGLPVSDRPTSGGRFRSDGTIGNPSGSTSLARRWGASGPLDSDEESDWLDASLTSWGVRTP